MGASVKKKRPPHWNKTDTILQAVYDGEITAYGGTLRNMALYSQRTLTSRRWLTPGSTGGNDARRLNEESY